MERTLEIDVADGIDFFYHDTYFSENPKFRIHVHSLLTEFSYLIEDSFII